MKTQLNGYKQIIQTKQGLELAILKQIKLYHFSFGYHYKLDFDQINNVKFPSPIGGEPFDAVEKVRLTKLDTKNSICIIETSKIIDSKTVTKTIMDFLKKTNKDQIKEIETEFRNKKLEMNEKSMHEIDFAKGIIKKAYFKRTMNLGIQNRTLLYEIQSVD